MDVNEPNQTVNPSEAPSQPIQHPINNQRGNFLIILGVLVLLLVVGGGAYYLGTQNGQTKNIDTQLPMSSQINTSPTSIPVATQVPSSTETANWKIYIHPQYKYSIKYPPSVEFTMDRFHFIGDKNRKDTADGFGPHLAIYFRGDKSPAEAAKEELSTANLKDVELGNATGVQVLDREFDYYLAPNGKSSPVLRILYSPNDYSPTVSKDKVSEMKVIAEQMLSTFKFTN